MMQGIFSSWRNPTTGPCCTSCCILFPPSLGCKDKFFPLWKKLTECLSLSSSAFYELTPFIFTVGREGRSPHYPHFKEMDTEKQRGQISSPRSHRWEMAEPGSKDRETWHLAICLSGILSARLLRKKSSETNQLNSCARLGAVAAPLPPKPTPSGRAPWYQGLPAVLRLTENSALCLEFSAC